MRHLIALAAILSLTTLAAPQEARAQEKNSAFGVGVQALLTGPAGPSLTYDVGLLHFDFLTFFETLGQDTFALGARGFYSVHQTERSDLSLGGGIGFTFEEDDGGGGGDDDDDVDFSVEFGAKMRMFVVPNVAITAFMGLAVVIDDDGNGGGGNVFTFFQEEDGIVLGGQFNALFGFTYYFH